MAPEWKYLLEQLQPQSLAVLSGLAGYREEEWQQLLAGFRPTIVLTPPLVRHLKAVMEEMLQGYLPVPADDLAAWVDKANELDKDDLAPAGGEVYVRMVEAVCETVVSLYALNVVSVLLNNLIKEKTGNKQPIPPAHELLKQINFTEVLKRIPAKLNPEGTKAGSGEQETGDQ